MTTEIWGGVPERNTVSRQELKTKKNDRGECKKGEQRPDETKREKKSRKFP